MICPENDWILLFDDINTDASQKVYEKYMRMIDEEKSIDSATQFIGCQMARFHSMPRTPHVISAVELYVKSAAWLLKPGDTEIPQGHFYDISCSTDPMLLHDCVIETEREFHLFTMNYIMFHTSEKEMKRKEEYYSTSTVAFERFVLAVLRLMGYSGTVDTAEYLVNLYRTTYSFSTDIDCIELMRVFILGRLFVRDNFKYASYSDNVKPRKSKLFPISPRAAETARSKVESYGDYDDALKAHHSGEDEEYRGKGGEFKPISVGDILIIFHKCYPIHY